MGYTTRGPRAVCPMRTSRNILRIHESCILCRSTSQACLITVDLRHNANKYPKGWLIDGLERMNLPQKTRNGTCLFVSSGAGSFFRPCATWAAGIISPSSYRQHVFICKLREVAPAMLCGEAWEVLLQHTHESWVCWSSTSQASPHNKPGGPPSSCKQMSQGSANGSMSSSASLSRACSVKSPRPRCVKGPRTCFCNTLTSRGYVGATRSRPPDTTSPVDLRHPGNRCRQGLALLSKP